MLAVLHAVHLVASNAEIPAGYFGAEVLAILKEVKVSSGCSLFRLIATRLASQLLRSEALGDFRVPLERVLALTVCDPQWRCRFLLYADICASGKFSLFAFAPEGYEFPFLQQNALGADVQLPLQDRRYLPSFFRLITDVVHQLRVLGLQILGSIFAEWFGTEIAFFSGATLNFDGHD